MSYGTDILAEAEGRAPVTMYHQVYAAIWKRHALNQAAADFWQRVFKVLSPGERAFILAHEFFCSFADGGYERYFIEKDGYTRAHGAVRLFRQVGLIQAADCLQKALEAASIPDPLPDGYQYAASPNVKLEEAEQEYLRVRTSEDFEGTLVNYFKQHVDDFA